MKGKGSSNLIVSDPIYPLDVGVSEKTKGFHKLIDEQEKKRAIMDRNKIVKRNINLKIKKPLCNLKKEEKKIYEANGKRKIEFNNDDLKEFILSNGGIERFVNIFGLKLDKNNEKLHNDNLETKNSMKISESKIKKGQESKIKNLISKESENETNDANSKKEKVDKEISSEKEEEDKRLSEQTEIAENLINEKLNEESKGFNEKETKKKSESKEQSNLFTQSFFENNTKLFDWSLNDKEKDDSINKKSEIQRDKNENSIFNVNGNVPNLFAPVIELKEEDESISMPKKIKEGIKEESKEQNEDKSNIDKNKPKPVIPIEPKEDDKKEELKISLKNETNNTVVDKNPLFDFSTKEPIQQLPTLTPTHIINSMENSESEKDKSFSFRNEEKTSDIIQPSNIVSSNNNPIQEPSSHENKNKASVFLMNNNAGSASQALDSLINSNERAFNFVNGNQNQSTNDNFGSNLNDIFTKSNQSQIFTSTKPIFPNPSTSNIPSIGNYGNSPLFIQNNHSPSPLNNAFIPSTSAISGMEEEMGFSSGQNLNSNPNYNTNSNFNINPMNSQYNYYSQPQHPQNNNYDIFQQPMSSQPNIFPNVKTEQINNLFSSQTSNNASSMLFGDSKKQNNQTKGYYSRRDGKGPQKI